MGSCDSPATMEEPLCRPVVQLPECVEFSGEPLPEQLSCPKAIHTSFDSNAAPTSEPDRDLGLTRNCISVNATELTVECGDGLVGETENMDAPILENKLDNNCGITGACLNENRGDTLNLDTGRSSLETEESQGANGKVNSLEACDMNSEVTAMGGSLNKFVQPNEETNEVNVSCASTQELKEFMKEKYSTLAGTEANNGAPMSPPHGYEMLPSFASVDCLPSNCTQQSGMKESQNVDGPLSEVLNGKDDFLAEIEAEKFNMISHSQGDRLSSILVHSGDIAADSYQNSGWMYGKGESCFLMEGVNMIADVKNDSDMGVQVAHPQDCQKLLEHLQLDDSLTICAQHDGKCDDKIVSGLLVETIPEVIEGNNDVTTDIKADVGKNTLLLVENTCNLKGGCSSSTTPNCIIEKLASLSYQPSDVTDSSSNKLDAPNLQCVGSVNFSSVTDSSGQNSVNKKDNIIVEFVSEMKCPETVATFLQRNGRRSKSCRKNQTKRVPRKRNTTKMPLPHQNIEIIFETARRKRSCISKRARSSIWGSLGYVSQAFEQSNEHLVSQVQNQGLGGKRGRQGNGKRNKKQETGSSRESRKGSGGQSSTSTGRICLKVKLGKGLNQSCLNIIVPDVVGTTLSSTAVTSNYGSESYLGTNLELVKLTNGVEDRRAEERQVYCYSGNPESAKTCDSSNLNDQPANNDSSSTVITEKSSDATEQLERSSETRCMDPGTSPDSEVINSISDAQVHQELQNSTLTLSKDFVSPGNVKISKRDKKKEKLRRAGDNSLVGIAGQPANRNRDKFSKKHGRRLNSGNDFCFSGAVSSSMAANALSHCSISEELPTEPLPLTREIAFGEAMKVEDCMDAEACCKTEFASGFSELLNSESCLPSKSTGQKLSKGAKLVKMSKSRSKVSDPTKRRGNAYRQRENQQKCVHKRKTKENGVCDQVLSKEDHTGIGNHMVDNIGITRNGDDIACTEASNLSVVQDVPIGYIPPSNAWVLCDDCHKWRRIPAAIVDNIGQANCTWTCKDNMDKDFADCSIPQEKSNAEINAELEISDASGEEDASNDRRTYRLLEYQRPIAPQEHAFKRIGSNKFLHRTRKTQSIDEIMVCHCKPPRDGRLGCGDQCLNRVLNIECVQGTCPCGDVCSNQQFQKKQYAKLEWFRCGKKGYGLQLLEDISQGQFLIEYVGEVLDMHSYEARQKEYALNGHRHFYFMTLNGSEVIDACAKGNLGRFINHSCDPNCRTEKWMVNGEICIGLFAIRDIKKGEEVTFDYNYVRVFGAAAKKCYCGSPQCRGYIGGDPLNSEFVVQSDSDEEFPEPVMLPEDGKTGDSRLTKATSSKGAGKQTVETKNDRDNMDKSINFIRQWETETQREDAINHSVPSLSQLNSSLEFEDSKARLPSTIQPPEISEQTEDVTSKPTTIPCDISAVKETRKPCSFEKVEISCPTLMLIGSTDSNKKSKSDSVDDEQELPKAPPRMKTSRKSGSVKKEKANGHSLNVEKVQVIANKSHILSIKPKKLMEGSPSGRFEAVEEKLNELLDADGGISRRKDAPKGYLKLLLLTAASGGSGNGEAIQSNRELSMILDALLKTKSRMVLIDIINKNGLRMLHNIMKQYRRDFKKIPILRKLLKVLEHMALREILTPEHINGGPPCPGMESFRESMLSLTDHDDRQVHQIARNFRDRWIPRPVRKLGFIERDGTRMEINKGPTVNRFSASPSYLHNQPSRPTEVIDCVKQPMLTTSVDPHTPEGSSVAHTGSEKRTRKRKSRWDQPAETNLESKSLQCKEQKIESRLLEQIESGSLDRIGEVTVDHVANLKEEESFSGTSQCQQDEVVSEDVPPGFSSPLIPPVSRNCSAATDLTQQSIGHSNCSFATIGHPQEKFISRLPVSYGIPLSIVQQIGLPQTENLQSWIIAPGMPFNPFPPLPPTLRDKNIHPDCDAIIVKESCEEGRSCCYSDESTPRTTSAPHRDWDISCEKKQEMKQVKESSNDLGRKYFRQQKWNSAKLGPPWLRSRNGWGGNMGNNSRNGVCTVDIGNVANEGGSSYCSDKVSYRGDKASNDFYPLPQTGSGFYQLPPQNQNQQ